MTEEDAPGEWPIREVAKATGLTSRTLRHYEQIGLLMPSRVGDNGYRFYGEAELSRLYRILSLRSLGLPLPAIDAALADDQPLAESIRVQLRLVEERRDRINNQIAALQQSLSAVERGETMNIDDIFAGFDPAQYEGEVRERWGDDAWESGASRRSTMTPAERTADDERSADVTSRLRAAAEAGEDPAGRAVPGADLRASPVGDRALGRARTIEGGLPRAGPALRHGRALCGCLRRAGQRRGDPGRDPALGRAQPVGPIAV